MRRGGATQGDDTRVKLEVLLRSTGALWFGIAADVKCDLSVTLTHCQQSLPPLDASPAAAIGSAPWLEVAQTVWCHVVRGLALLALSSTGAPTVRSMLEMTGVTPLVASRCACTLHLLLSEKHDSELPSRPGANGSMVSNLNANFLVAGVSIWGTEA